MRKKITINTKELKQDVNKYLDLVYLDHTDVIVKEKGRLFLIKSLTPPCQYTIDELKDRLKESEADIKAERYYTHEEVILLLKVNDLEDIRYKLSEKIDSPELAQMLLVYIDEIEKSGKRPSSIFDDKDVIEKLIDKRNSFND